MKADQIRAGGTYALPAREVQGFGGSPGYRQPTAGVLGTQAHVNEGRMAAPCKVVAVGKFRWRQSGACQQEIVSDHYTTTAHVRVPDVMKTFVLADIYQLREKAPKNDERIGYKDGLSLLSKKIVWRDEIVPLNRIIMPWDDFLKRREEYVFVQAEIYAMQQRLEVIQKEARKIAVDASRSMSLDEPPARTIVRDEHSFREIDPHGERRHWRSDISTATHVAIERTVFIPLSDVADFTALMAEAAEINRRLSCAR